MLQKRVTLRDLAEELGISVRSVSQALHPRESNVQLSASTTEKVQKLARERGYRVDSRARSMCYGRFFNIGYFEAKNAPRSWPMLGAESGVFDEANERKYKVVLVQLPQKNSNAIPSIFKEANLDALILCHAGNLSRQLEKVIDGSNLPVVYLNEKKRYNSVYINDILGAVTVTKHLISQGRRRIVYLSVSTKEKHYSLGDRKAGYLQAMSEARLKTTVLEYPDGIEWEFQFRKWFEAEKDNIDGIVCSCDFWANRIFRVLYRYFDLFPGKVAITGFDDFAMEISPLPLTTMEIPFYEIGREAVRMALTLVDQNQKRIPSRIFDPKLIVRDSSTPL